MAKKTTELDKASLRLLAISKSIRHWENLSLKNIRGERWLPIKGFESRYKISNMGRVKSLEREVNRKCDSVFMQKEIIKRQGFNKHGYLYVHLWVVKKGKYKTMQRLVGEHFLENHNNFRQINHRWGIKTDNRALALEWSTPSNNLKHAYKYGLMCQKGENHATLKLNNKKVMEIFNSPLETKKLEKKYSISSTMVRNIKSGRSWSHLTGKEYKMSERMSEKLILELINSPLRSADAARKFKVPAGCVYAIRNGRRWSHITGKTPKHEKKTA